MVSSASQHSSRLTERARSAWEEEGGSPESDHRANSVGRARCVKGNHRVSDRRATAWHRVRCCFSKWREIIQEVAKQGKHHQIEIILQLNRIYQFSSNYLSRCPSNSIPFDLLSEGQKKACSFHSFTFSRKGPPLIFSVFMPNQVENYEHFFHA